MRKTLICLAAVSLAVACLDIVHAESAKNTRATARAPRTAAPLSPLPVGSQLPATLPHMATIDTKTETWDTSGTDGWWAMGGPTKVERISYLQASGFVGADSVGVFTTRSELVGAFDVKGKVAFDLKVALQQTTDYAPAVLIQHDSGARYWYHVLPFSNSNQWEHREVAVDPTWTDEQAVAAGWKMQSGGQAPAISWRDTVATFYRIGILMQGPYNAHGFACTVCLDNFAVTK